MSVTRSFLGTLGLALALTLPAAAQDRALVFFARGGGFNGLTNLDQAGTTDFKRTGYNVGGGVGVQVQKYVALRGDFTFARNEMRNNQAPTGIRLNRLLYDAAVQLQYPTSGGFTPYLFAGGGAVTLHQVGTSGQNRTRGAGTLGLGFNYQIPRSPLGIFAEGKSWLYQAKNLGGALVGFDKTQYEVAWSGGFSYRLPF